MFGPDPIDLWDFSPYAAWAYYGHMVIGTIALLAAIFALAAKKGGKRHLFWGYSYIATVAFVCVTTVSLLADNFIPPLMVALCTAIYAIGGAWLALQPGTKRVRRAEVALSLLEIAALIVFLAVALPAAQAGRIPLFAPLVILLIPAILLLGDLNWFRSQDRRRELRIQRHLARMVWGFVVVIRAPLVELAAAGVPLSQPAVTFGPILIAAGLLWYFQRRWGGAPFGMKRAPRRETTA